MRNNKSTRKIIIGLSTLLMVIPTFTMLNMGVAPLEANATYTYNINLEDISTETYKEEAKEFEGYSLAKDLIYNEVETGITYYVDMYYKGIEDEETKDIIVTEALAMITGGKLGTNVNVTLPSTVEDVIPKDSTKYNGPDFTGLGKFEVKKIGDNAFKDNTYVSVVTIPENINHIGTKAFADTRLTDVKYTGTNLKVDDLAFSNTYMKTLPQDLLNIDLQLGKKVFANNEFISKVTTGAWTDIPEGTFQNCSNLSEVVIEKNAQIVGDITISVDKNNHQLLFTGNGVGVFQDCVNLATVTFEDATNIKILGDNLFKGCINILEISLDGLNIDTTKYKAYVDEENKPLEYEVIQGIGLSVYANCSNLKEATLGNFNYVPANIFSGCTSLVKVEMPNIENIRAGAFANCKSLTDIDIPTECEIIDDSAFEGCSNLKEINIPSKTHYLGTSAFKDCTSLKKVTGGEGVFQGMIANSLFENCNTLVEIPSLENATEIGSYAFKGTALKELDLPLVDTIGNNAFSECNNLISVKADNTRTLGENAFSSCEYLKEVYLNSVDEIGKEAFKNCSALNTIEMPQVRFIKDSAFLDCKQLNTQLPTTLLEVGDSSFKNCMKLETSLSGMKWNTIGSNAFTNTSITDVNISYKDTDNDTLTIGDKAFNDCPLLEKASIQCPTTSKVGKELFKGCTSLKDCFYDGKVIGKGMFSGCTSLVNIETPNAISIGESAFLDCSSLEEYTTSTSLEDINAKAFSGCTSLRNFNVINPKKVTYNGEGIFTNCTSLESIELNSTVISKAMFDNCTSLKEVKSLDIITTVEDTAFRNCQNLSTFDLSTVSTLGTEAFAGCTSLNNIQLCEDLATLSEKVFANCQNLDHIELPNSISQIKGQAFAGCTKLQGIAIPENVTVIGIEAFSGCTGLKYVDFNNNNAIQVINKRTFAKCSNLTEIEIPSSIQRIEEKAFADCDKLIKISFADETHENLKYIGDYAFYNCNAMNYLYIPYTNVTYANKCIGGTDKAESQSLLTVYGIKGSTLEEYCTKNKLNFIAIESIDTMLKGDINFDNAITTMDLLLLKKSILGALDIEAIKTNNEDEKQTYSSLQADMNDDGNINVIDVIMLKNKLIQD